MDLLEFYKLGNDSDFIDKMIDDYQKKLGEREDNFVMESRLGFYFIPHSVKVYLKADERERARRVYTDEKKRTGESFMSLEDALKSIREREESDRRRFKKWQNKRKGGSRTAS